MFSRFSRLVALAVALVVPTLGFAADEKKADGPSLLIRIQSISNLVKTVEYFAGFADEEQAEQAKQGIGLLKSLMDDKKGIEGIDVNHPIGLYANLTPEVTSSPVVLLVPIADEESILTALKTRANLEIKKGNDGVYETTPPNMPMTLYFRFANKYAYITANDPQNIDTKTLPKPEAVLSGGKAESLVSAIVRLDRLPEQMKRLALGALENQMATAKEQPIDNETPALKALKVGLIDQVANTVKSVLNEGEEVGIRLNVDTKGGEVSFEVETSGTKGSKLSKDIASIASNKSVVGGAIADPNAAFSMNVSAVVAESIKKLIPPVLDELIAKAKKDSNAPGEALELLNPLIESIKPTANSGDYDFGVAMTGPDSKGHMTMLVGVKAKEGTKVETAIMDMAKKLPPEIAEKLQLNGDKLDGKSSLHIVKIANELDEKGKKIFGANDLNLSFRDDLVIVGIGPTAKDNLKKAVMASPADTGILSVNVALSKFAPVVAETPDQAAQAKKIAEKVFGTTPTKDDVVTLSLTGGNSLKLKFAAKGKALQFLKEFGDATKKKDQ
jgi:hypothetical protein